MPGLFDWAWRTVIVAGLLFVGMYPDTARAGDNAGPIPLSTSIPTSGFEARPTLAWTEFCTRNPAECTIDRSEASRITLDSDVWSRIVAVNEQVNLAIAPVPDDLHWGVEDRWDYPDDGQGDCEDIQLLKRQRLVEAGLPRRALRMAVVLDRVGAGHAVLVVHTDRGDFVLDNAVGAVLPWDETGYHFIKQEGQDELAWIAFGDPQPTPTVTAQK